MKAKNIDKALLIDLYVTKKLTSCEIAEILKVNRTTVNRYVKIYGIAPNPKQRKYGLIKKVPFTKEQREFLIGTLLGDGCVAPHGRKNKSYRLVLSHCEKQKDLLLWKKAIMGNFVNVINKKVVAEKNSTMYSFASVTHDEFKFYYKLFYENGKKIIRDELINYITDFSLAVWIMDDGSLNNKVNLRLSTDGFTEAENIKLQSFLKINFDLRCKICKYTRRGKEFCFLSFNKENTIKASKIVEKYFVDCMRYKLYDSPTTNMPNSESTSSDEDRV